MSHYDTSLGETFNIVFDFSGTNMDSYDAKSSDYVTIEVIEEANLADPDV